MSLLLSYKFASGIKSQIPNLVVCVKVLINIVNNQNTAAYYD